MYIYIFFNLLGLAFRSVLTWSSRAYPNACFRSCSFPPHCLGARPPGSRNFSTVRELFFRHHSKTEWLHLVFQFQSFSEPGACSSWKEFRVVSERRDGLVRLRPRPHPSIRDPSTVPRIIFLRHGELTFKQNVCTTVSQWSLSFTFEPAVCNDRAPGSCIGPLLAFRFPHTEGTTSDASHEKTKTMK